MTKTKTDPNPTTNRNPNPNRKKLQNCKVTGTLYSIYIRRVVKCESVNVRKCEIVNV